MRNPRFECEFQCKIPFSDVPLPAAVSCSVLSTPHIPSILVTPEMNGFHTTLLFEHMCIRIRKLPYFQKYSPYESVESGYVSTFLSNKFLMTYVYVYRHVTMAVYPKSRIDLNIRISI